MIGPQSLHFSRSIETEEGLLMNPDLEYGRTVTQNLAFNEPLGPLAQTYQQPKTSNRENIQLALQRSEYSKLGAKG